jgi:hypothetical protein
MTQDVARSRLQGFVSFSKSCKCNATSTTGTTRTETIEGPDGITIRATYDPQPSFDCCGNLGRGG